MQELLVNVRGGQYIGYQPVLVKLKDNVDYLCWHLSSSLKHIKKSNC